MLDESSTRLWKTMTRNLGEVERSPFASDRHPAALLEEDLLTQCQLRRQRRSGPGGQHRNKVETAVMITHTPTGIRGEASERRSQEENRARALFRLRINLALAVRMPVDWESFATSPLWKSRCRAGRVSVNPGHSDFPALLAEAIDVLTATDFDVKSSAERLGCSSSQLIKFLQLEPRAMEALNRQRRTQGKSPYR